MLSEGKDDSVVTLTSEYQSQIVIIMQSVWLITSHIILVIKADRKRFFVQELMSQPRRLGSKYSSPASSETDQMVKCLKRMRVSDAQPMELSRSPSAKKKEQLVRLLDDQMRRYRGELAARSSTKFSTCE